MQEDNVYRSVWLELMDTPFEQNWVTAANIRTRYVRSGPRNAPAVIMLHGTAGSWETFCRNIPYLAKDFDCVAFDLVGTGFSDKPDYPYEIPRFSEHVAAVLNSLEIERASFIGVSLGAWISAKFALDNPSRVDRLILISPAGLVSNAETMSGIKSRRTKAVDDPSWDNISEIIGRLVYDAKSVPNDIVAIRQATYRLPDMKQAMNNLLVLQDPEIRQQNNITAREWASITAPTLIIRASDVADIYSQSAAQLPEIMPNAIMENFSKVNHWAHFEDASRFNRLASAFLRGVDHAGC